MIRSKPDAPSRSATPRAVQFRQFDISFDELTIPRSGWGRLSFSTEGWTRPLFCNLALEERWQVRNVLIIPEKRRCAMSRSRTRRRHVMTIPIGTPDGMVVEKMAYGLAFTRQPLIDPPAASKSAHFLPAIYSINHNFQDTPVDYFPGQPLGGVFFSRGPSHGHPEIHNHPCGPNECVPNAVRLALEYLWVHYGLEGKGIPWAKFDLVALKLNLGWTRSVGCPNGQRGTSHWEDLKDSYLRDLCAGLGFKINTKRLSSSDAAKAYDALDKEECVVELDAGDHCVAVRTMTPNLDEKGNVTSYDVEVMNCAAQDGKDSSCSTEHLTVKPDGTITDGQGAPWSGGQVRNWCVQCYQAL